MASILNDIENLDERGKKVMKTLSNDTRDSKNVKQFIENLSKIIELVPVEQKETIRAIVKEVLTMPTDNYPLFITLIRFEYNYLKS
jgi:archaellum component FlaC